MDLPAASKLSPDCTKHSEWHHVTISVWCRCRTSYILLFYSTVLILFHISSSHSPPDVPNHLSDDNKLQLLMAETCDPE